MELKKRSFFCLGVAVGREEKWGEGGGTAEKAGERWRRKGGLDKGRRLVLEEETNEEEVDWNYNQIDWDRSKIFRNAKEEH